MEQDGTLAECYGRTAYYYMWWEMYPTTSIQVVGQSLQPGDAISASVVRSGTSYTLKVTDSSRPADSFSTTQACSGCANSSAEWIAEAPSGSSGVYPLRLPQLDRVGRDGIVRLHVRGHLVLHR